MFMSVFKVLIGLIVFAYAMIFC